MTTYIDEHKDRFGVEPICAVLPIAPSTYYEQKARQRDPERRPLRAIRDEALKPEVQRVWDENFAQTYEEAASLGFGGTQHGESAVFTYLIPIPPEPSTAFYIENFRGFTLVPEPSMALLAIIGIVGLYFARRGKN